AEADNTAVAGFAPSAAAAGLEAATGDDRLLGRFPVGWYPSALAATADRLLVVNAKGRGTAPNPRMVQDSRHRSPRSRDYVLGQLQRTLMRVPWATLDPLRPLTDRVEAANGWRRSRTGSPPPAPRSPPFKPSIYV